MDAAFAVAKKTALFLSLALLAAVPRLAQADTAAFTSPTNSTVITLVNGVASSVSVTGSQDTGNPFQPISFGAAVAYQAGDPHWLSVGGDTNPSGGCTGGSFSYTTPANLSLGLGCLGQSLLPGLHTATVTLNPTAPTGAAAVTFQVNYNTNGGGGSTLVSNPTNLTGGNAMSAAVGAQVAANVMLQTTSSTAIGYGDDRGELADRSGEHQPGDELGAGKPHLHRQLGGTVGRHLWHHRNRELRRRPTTDHFGDV